MNRWIECGGRELAQIIATRWHHLNSTCDYFIFSFVWFEKLEASTILEKGKEINNTVEKIWKLLFESTNIDYNLIYTKLYYIMGVQNQTNHIKNRNIKIVNNRI